MTKQRNLWKAALEAAFTSLGMVLQQSLGEWMRAPTQVWRNFFNLGTQHVVTSTTGLATQFTEYEIHQQTKHNVNATPVEVASIYVTLEDVDWNVMIPATSVTNSNSKHYCQIPFPHHNRTNTATFDEYMKTLPDHVQQLLMHIELVPGGEQMLKHCLANDKIATEDWN